MKFICNILLCTLLIFAVSCKKEKTQNQGTPVTPVFNHTFELTLDGTPLSKDDVTIFHFEEEHIIQMNATVGDNYFMIRIKDTVQTGQNLAMTDDLYDSQVFFYYSNDPDVSGYLPETGSQLKVVEHNTETREIKAVFAGTMKNQGSIVTVKNGKLKINY